jgi:RNase H-fold protein (predicted Holliday junction resolvase)
MQSPVLIGFDPGRDKCGYALITTDGQVLDHRILAATRALDTLEQAWRSYPVEAIVIGNQTTSRQWQQQLENRPGAPPVQPVNERNSTLEARERYWQLYPPQGWRRLLPAGLREPPRPVDDIVAIVLLERYLGQSARVERRIDPHT